MSTLPAPDIHAAWRSLLADDIDRANGAMRSLLVVTERVRDAAIAFQVADKHGRIKRMHAMYRRRRR